LSTSLLGNGGCAIEWPAPKALPVGPLVNYGYDGTVLHLVNLEVSADLKPGSYKVILGGALAEELGVKVGVGHEIRTVDNDRKHPLILAAS